MWKACVWRLRLSNYGCASLNILFTTSEFSSTSPFKAIRSRTRPLAPSLASVTKPPDSRPRLHSYSAVWNNSCYKSHSKKIITIVIIMAGSYSLEKGMVYYHVAYTVTDHYSLSVTLFSSPYFSLFPSRNTSLSLSIFHVHSDSKPQRHNNGIRSTVTVQDTALHSYTDTVLILFLNVNRLST